MKSQFFPTIFQMDGNGCLHGRVNGVNGITEKSVYHAVYDSGHVKGPRVKNANVKVIRAMLHSFLYRSGFSPTPSTTWLSSGYFTSRHPLCRRTLRRPPCRMSPRRSISGRSSHVTIKFDRSKTCPHAAETEWPSSTPTSRRRCSAPSTRGRWWRRERSPLPGSTTRATPSSSDPLKNHRPSSPTTRRKGTTCPRSRC